MKDAMDYKKLYFALFNNLTKFIEQLQQYQSDAEERYLDAAEEPQERARDRTVIPRPFV